MADVDGQAGFVRQAVQASFPQPRTTSVAAARVRDSQQLLGGVQVRWRADAAPRAADALDRKFGRFMIGSDADPTFMYVCLGVDSLMENNVFEKALRTRLQDRWAWSTPVGYSLGEISLAKSQLGIEFPDAYARFLRVCGREAGSLFRGYHWSLESRNSRNCELQCCVKEDGVGIQGSVFAFLDFDGDYFWCFSDSRAPDPIVYIYDHVAYSSVGRCFSEFVLQWDHVE